MKILLVEDNDSTRLTFEEHIQSLGYEVAACTDTETALETYQNTFYPLVILNLGLPGMDRVEFCCHIRALPQGDHSMILAVMAHDQQEYLKTALDAGVDDYLMKPVSMEQLQARLTIIGRHLRNLAQRKRAEDALIQEQSLLHGLMDSIPDHIYVKDIDSLLSSE